MGYCADMVSCKFYVKTEHFGKVYKKLEDYGYAPETDDDSNVTGLDFVGDKVAYDEDEMFEEIAPFVEDGSFIEMSGEDGARWRWVFSSGTVREVRAKVVWDDE
jgi:hypothetical protein